MSHQEARAWWADVEHLREEFEERRARPSLRLVDAGTPAAPGDPRAVAPNTADRPEAARTADPQAPRARRTVQITGRGSQAPTPRRLVEVDRRRPAPSIAQRAGGRPDRIAAWAVVLGLVLVLVAAVTTGA